MKILIVRFSSIGDLVLTTPVIRCLKQQTNAEIHFLSFNRFKAVLENNPYIDRFITVNRSIREVVKELRNEKYDLVVDLHRNIRTISLKLRLLRPSVSFPKLNLRKYLLVRLRINLMPPLHIVDRYMSTLKKLEVKYDNKGLDYFLPDEGLHEADSIMENYPDGFAAIVIGGRYFTKIYPEDLVTELILKTEYPVILLGGVEDFERGETILKSSSGKEVLNACGKFALNESASIISKATVVITNDTGLMHIAAAFHRKIISIWGNTVPALGMTPFMPADLTHYSRIIEAQNVSCRPCSKLGFGKCPKSHFKCMREIRPEVIEFVMNEMIAH